MIKTPPMSDNDDNVKINGRDNPPPNKRKIAAEKRSLNEEANEIEEEEVEDKEEFEKENP
jgi:hypothetical protein